MIERKLLPDFPPEVIEEVKLLTGPADEDELPDLRRFCWFSLDNDDSRDLDQITYAEERDNSTFVIFVAIADVDALVQMDSAIDRYAQKNTTSVYTPGKIFTMLPEKLSTDLTSLNEHQDRLAVIFEVVVDKDGSLLQSTVYRAKVKNHAKLCYDSVSAWLDGTKPAPDPIQASRELEEQVMLQDRIAGILYAFRHREGALTLQTIELKAVMDRQKVLDLVPMIKNRGRDLIEDFMIAANRSSVNFLEYHQFPSLRRVVRTPKRWDRIAAIAQELGTVLPEEPDAKALDLFLVKQRSKDPEHFPDLSLTVIKLLGNGEYVAHYPGQEPVGHFSLAVKNYAHSTAPNRRYPDLITQRLIKAAIQGSPPPYTPKELEELAKRCTQKEDDAEKVERKMKKSAACLLLLDKINQPFDALVTGAAQKGTWVRTIMPPVEGKLIGGFEQVDVGDKIQVRLVSVDVEKGYIDFVRL